MSAKNWRRWSIALAGVALVLLLGWWWIRAAASREQASPDAYDLGQVYAGSTVEFSARFLTVENRPWDALFDKLLQILPPAWRPTLSKLHPSNSRPKAPKADLATLKPVVNTPDFLRVEQVLPQQVQYWYDNRPFVVLHLKLAPLKPGQYTGRVTVRLDRRQASLPVRVKVRPTPAGLPKLLVAETPYQSDSTSRGADFDATTRLFSGLEFQTDYLHQLPQHLEDYRVILLGESSLVDLGESNATRLWAFVSAGGRLVIACNAFFVGTVSRANEILAGSGLQVRDKDYGGHIVLTNLPSNPWTRGVSRLHFHRPSLIEVTDATKARVVVAAPGSSGGFVAVSQAKSGGEIIVLGESLWWVWLAGYQDAQDNVRLMRNLLMGPAENEGARDHRSK